ncbi:MAG: glutaredoxin 3 [Bauldia sp.]
MPKIEIYSRPLCGYCELAKKLLDRKGLSYRERDVSADRSLLAEVIGRSGGRMALPQVFIGGRHVGGFVELAELDRHGQLEELLAA